MNLQVRVQGSGGEHHPLRTLQACVALRNPDHPRSVMRLMDKILHYLKDPKLWELWYIPYNG